MRRTTPDLVGSRKTIYKYVSVGLLVLTIGYVLWTNYIVFVGGNLPLTPISLGTGSTGAGLTMMLVGDLILVLLIWFVLDGLLLNLLHLVLRAGNPRESSTVPQGQQQWQPQPAQQQQQWQPQSSSPMPTVPSVPPEPRDGGARATLVAPDAAAHSSFGSGTYGANEAAPVHRRWTPPTAG